MGMNAGLGVGRSEASEGLGLPDAGGGSIVQRLLREQGSVDTLILGF